MKTKMIRQIRVCRVLLNQKNDTTGIQSMMSAACCMVEESGKVYISIIVAHKYNQSPSYHLKKVR